MRLVEEAELLRFYKKFPGLNFKSAEKFSTRSRVEQALTNISARYIYPIIDGIPVLLAEAAFDMSLSAQDIKTLDEKKKKVLDFYNAQGWVSSSAGNYEDAIIYEDLRPVSAAYILACHKRVCRHLPLRGKYLLDAASGAVQYDIYLSYSENFEYRICVDFSLLALKEAQKKLGKKGIYLLCDIAHLPLNDSVIDAFVSLNTIYHIPAEEQVRSVKELYRSLVENGKGVLVYDWFKHSSWMNISLLPFRSFVFIKNKTILGLKKLTGKNDQGGRLYFFAHRLEYLRRQLPPFELFVWRTVSVPFLKYYVHSWLFGKSFLEWLYRFEERDPEICGKNGEYPMLVFEKKF
ncbi:MAG: methyltransferase domain-containing protein [Chitinophagaceae bacterium]